jgi:hypothetical protein
MSLTAISPNILVKVPKNIEIKRREKEGQIYLHPSFVWMTKNTQYGIIESISPSAKEEFPESKKGQLLIIHHFTQGSHSVLENTKKFLVHEDEEYNYYNVTTTEWNGQNTQSYGVWDGEKITPHKNYIFLKKETEDKEGWYETEDETLERLAIIKQKSINLARTQLTPEIITQVQNWEREMLSINKNLQKKEYIQKEIAHCHPKSGFTNGQSIYIFNKAANLVIEFQGTEYIVAETKYIVAI